MNYNYLCTSLNLKECRGCEYVRANQVSFAPHMMCWISHYSNKINAIPDDKIKDYILETIFPNQFNYYDPDWRYYCINALKLFPHKYNIVESLLLLI